MKGKGSKNWTEEEKEEVFLALMEAPGSLSDIAGRLKRVSVPLGRRTETSIYRELARMCREIRADSEAAGGHFARA